MASGGWSAVIVRMRRGSAPRNRGSVAGVPTPCDGAPREREAPSMRRADRIFLSALACVVPAGVAAQNAVGDPTGLWGSEQRLGPAVRGTLTIVRAGSEWRATIAGRSASVGIA